MGMKQAERKRWSDILLWDLAQGRVDDFERHLAEHPEEDWLSIVAKDCNTINAKGVKDPDGNEVIKVHLFRRNKFVTVLSSFDGLARLMIGTLNSETNKWWGPSALEGVRVLNALKDQHHAFEPAFLKSLKTAALISENIEALAWLYEHHREQMNQFDYGDSSLGALFDQAHDAGIGKTMADFKKTLIKLCERGVVRSSVDSLGIGDFYRNDKPELAEVLLDQGFKPYRSYRNSSLNIFSSILHLTRTEMATPSKVEEDANESKMEGVEITHKGYDLERGLPFSHAIKDLDIPTVLKNFDRISLTDKDLYLPTPAQCVSLQKAELPLQARMGIDPFEASSYHFKSASSSSDYQGLIEIWKRLLQAGFDINLNSDFLAREVVRWIRTGNPLLLKAALSLGADLNRNPEAMLTHALDWIRKKKDQPGDFIIDQLMAWGLNPSLCAQKSTNHPVGYCLGRGNFIEGARLMVRKGVSPIWQWSIDKEQYMDSFKDFAQGSGRFTKPPNSVKRETGESDGTGHDALALPSSVTTQLGSKASDFAALSGFLDDSEPSESAGSTLHSFEGLGILHFAIQHASEEGVEFFDFLMQQPFLAQQINDQKVRTSTLGEKGSTLLHGACHIGNAGVAELLIRLGAKLDLQNDVGNTPLHMLMEKPSFSTSKKNVRPLLDLLLPFKHVLEIKNKEGQTPLDKALSSTWIKDWSSFEPLLKEQSHLILRGPDAKKWEERLKQTTVGAVLWDYLVLNERTVPIDAGVPFLNDDEAHKVNGQPMTPSLSKRRL